LVSLLVFAHKSKIAKAYVHDHLKCKHQPIVSKFLLGLEAQILEIAFSSGAERCRSKKLSILSILGLALCSTPSPHHHFIGHPALLILYLIDVKRVISSDHSSCIYHPFTHRISNPTWLFVSHVHCDMSYLFQ
jgi:hypothetical protein